MRRIKAKLLLTLVVIVGLPPVLSVDAQPAVTSGSYVARYLGGYDFVTLSADGGALTGTAKETIPKDGSFLVSESDVTGTEDGTNISLTFHDKATNERRDANGQGAYGRLRLVSGSTTEYFTASDSTTYATDVEHMVSASALDPAKVALQTNDFGSDNPPHSSDVSDNGLSVDNQFDGVVIEGQSTTVYSYATLYSSTNAAQYWFPDAVSRISSEDGEHALAPPQGLSGDAVLYTSFQDFGYGNTTASYTLAWTEGNHVA